MFVSVTGTAFGCVVLLEFVFPQILALSGYLPLFVASYPFSALGVFLFIFLTFICYSHNEKWFLSFFAFASGPTIYNEETLPEKIIKEQK